MFGIVFYCLERYKKVFEYYICMKIILASQSSSRKKALDLLGLEYEIVPSNIDEKAIREDDPYKLARMLSEAKARGVGEKQENSIIVAGDLIATVNGKLFEKPKDKKDAFEMLKMFSGNEMNILGGLAVYNSKTKKMLSYVGKCTVKFRGLTGPEIKDYISRHPVLKFGAALDDDGLLRFIEHLEGEYVIRTAFPMNKLIPFLRENGVKV